MSISIYLIRLIVSFFFGASLLCLILEHYFANSDDWYSANNNLRIISLTIVITMFIICGILLWVIK